MKKEKQISQKDIINLSSIFTAKETLNEKKKIKTPDRKKSFKTKIPTKISSPKHTNTSISSTSQLKQKYPLENEPKISRNIFS